MPYNIQQVNFTSRYWVVLLPCILMAADIITGWIQATINGTWDSTKMRKGLYRKSGEMLIIVLAYVISLAINLPFDVAAFIAGYVVIMELISVCENLNQAGLPVPVWIIKRLGKVAKDMTEDDPVEEVKE
ncbi:MAG: phage holin family protein [Blautia sp.]|nr:phage holin family protein [Blautia sp.]